MVCGEDLKYRHVAQGPQFCIVKAAPALILHPFLSTMAPSAEKSMQREVHQYVITGRAAPTLRNPVPKLMRMKLFAAGPVQARSKFWYFMKRQQGAKRSGGQILQMSEIFEKSPSKVNNYAIWLRYDSRTDTHNMYKEFVTPPSTASSVSCTAKWCVACSASPADAMPL